MTTLKVTTIINSQNDDYIVKKHNGLYLIKYKKSSLNNVNAIGLYRSVITDGENILSFAPPKSVNYDSFTKTNAFEDCNITEFIGYRCE